MNIDLSLLHSNTVEEIQIDEILDFPSKYYENTDIKKLDNIHVSGTIKRITDTEDEITLDVSGSMTLLDSISLEEVEYPFSTKIEGNLSEFSQKFENTLDIMELLWENIVLEIPLKFTKVMDLSKFHGDGWSLVSEEKATKNNNPFSELLKDFGEE